MTYYHIRITPKSRRSYSDDEVQLDLDRAELEERYLAPFRRNTSIVVNGRVFTIGDIRRIKISVTHENSESIRPIVEREMEIAKQRRRASGVIPISRRPSASWLIVDKGNDVTDDFISAPPGSESDSDISSKQHSRPPADAREVFVVHGRNERARTAMFEFLRAVDLNPLEWSEAVQATGQPNPYIGDVLNAAFSRVHAVVVLLTPDDEARLSKSLRVDNDPPHEVELSGQARPNVLFEAGMAMGRDEDRTVLVELGEMRPFSDIAGRHVIRLDNSSQRRQELAQRLEAAGCPVNLDGTDWHSAGDFDGALE